MGVETDFYRKTGAAQGKTIALAAGATAAHTDLAADTYIGDHVSRGVKLRIVAEGATVYFFFAADALQTISDTAGGTVTPAQQCDCIPANTAIDVYPPRIRGVFFSHLYYKCASGATAMVRISPCSNTQEYEGVR
jgi:hypothetical protein